MKRHEILYLSQKDVLSCGVLDMKAVIQSLEKVFLLHNRKEDILPAKVALRWGDAHSEETRGRINAMPGYVGGDINIAGIKWIGSAPNNPLTYGLPRASALIILNDPEKMFPLAVMDGTIISAMRTGGVTGLAAKYFARKDSKTAGIIGAGTQNRTQLMALKEVLPKLEKVRVYDLSEERSRTFAREVGESLGLSIDVVSRGEEALKGADVMVTATTAKGPIVFAEWLKPGCFYSHVGGYEADYGVIKKADKIAVDDWYQIKHRKTQTLALMFDEGLIDDSAIYAELGDVAAGKKPGRETDKEIVYFNSVGMAVEDIAVAKRVYDTALAQGTGIKLELWDTPLWV
jgi:ornithine cyclodeaminase